MGCYDTIFVPCPKCGEKYAAQSKGGDCVLAYYEIEDAPADVMSNVNRHAPFDCPQCGIQFAVELEFQKPKYKVVEIKKEQQ